jgi:hypothetical protein
LHRLPLQRLNGQVKTKQSLKISHLVVDDLDNGRHAWRAQSHVLAGHNRNKARNVGSVLQEDSPVDSIGDSSLHWQHE